MASPVAFRSDLYDRDTSPQHKREHRKSATPKKQRPQYGNRLEVPGSNNFSKRIPHSNSNSDEEEIAIPSVPSTEQPTSTSFVFILLYIGYASFYASRRSLSFLAPHLTQDLGFSKLQLGSLSSFFSLSYAVNKFIAGVLADAYPPTVLFALGLFTNGVLFTILSFTSSFGVFMVVCVINGVTQALGLAPIGGILEMFWSPSRKGSLWSSLSTAANLGNALMPLVGGAVSYFFGWQKLFLLMGLFCFTACGLTIKYLHYSEQAMIALWTDSKYQKRKRQPQTFSAVLDSLYKNIFSQRSLWLLSSAYFFVYVIRSAVSDWSVMYFVEHKEYSPMLAASAMIWLEIGGCAGAFTIGWISDKFFGGRRGPPILLFLLGSLVSFSATALCSEISSYVLDCTLLLLNGYAVYGPQVLIGVMASDLAGDGASSTAVGFVGVFAALGGSLAGAPMSMLIHHFHWHAMHLAVIASVLVAAACLLPLWDSRKLPKRE